MVLTSTGLFKLREQGASEDCSPPLSLDAFVQHVDSLGPQKPRRVTKLDAAFAKQLVKKS